MVLHGLVNDISRLRFRGDRRKENNPRADNSTTRGLRQQRLKPHFNQNMKCEYQFCGKEFTGRRNKRFCSNTCRTYHAHGNTTIPGIRLQRLIANPPKTNIYIKTCPVTGLLFITNKPQRTYHPSAIIPTQHSRNYKAIPKKVFNCEYCGESTESVRQKKRLLCNRCADRDYRRSVKAKIRALHREGDSISPYDIFTRDNWTCRICAIATPSRLRGTHEPNAPELDHITPISKGGSHTWMNLQCLCRSCNNNKSNKLIYASA